jgi:hypothetical protein
MPHFETVRAIDIPIFPEWNRSWHSRMVVVWEYRSEFADLVGEIERPNMYHTPNFQRERHHHHHSPMRHRLYYFRRFGGW